MASKPPRKEKLRATEGKMVEGAPASPKSSGTTDLVKEVSAAVVQALDTRFQELVDRIQNVSQNLIEFTGRMDQVEARVSDIEDARHSLETKVEALETLVKQQGDKLDELENRGRRKNLRFIGIPESVADGALFEYLQSWIEKLLQGKNEDPVKLERVHQLGQRREQLRHPRAVIARFLDYRQKEMVLRTARGRNMQQQDSPQILVLQDYSALVSQQRRAFSGVCTQLRNQGVRFSLLYPARLRVETNGQTRYLTTPAAAASLLGTVPSQTASPP